MCYVAAVVCDRKHGNAAFSVKVAMRSGGEALGLRGVVRSFQAVAAKDPLFRGKSKDGETGVWVPFDLLTDSAAIK